MFANNRFAELTAFLPPTAMHIEIVSMTVAVAAGTRIDKLHQGSTRI